MNYYCFFLRFVGTHYLIKANAHVCICDTDLWGRQVCPLLEWLVCYFYWRHKLLTMSVMTVQVSLILSSRVTNCISLLTDTSIIFPNLLNLVVCFSGRKSFTAALESVEPFQEIQSSKIGYDFTEKCICTAFYDN